MIGCLVLSITRLFEYLFVTSEIQRDPFSDVNRVLENLGRWQRPVDQSSPVDNYKRMVEKEYRHSTCLIT